MTSSGRESKRESKTVDSDSELDNWRKSINKEKSKKEVQKKSRTANKVTMWEELEMLYKDMEQREKDYQIAVEIGKMLLDKNKELEDKNDEMKTQYTLLLQERENELSTVLNEYEIVSKKNDELKAQVKQLQMSVNVLQGTKGDSETKALLLSEEFYSMEQKLEKYKKQAKEFKVKNKEIQEELKKTRIDLEITKDVTEKEITKKKTTERTKNNMPEESKSKEVIETSEEIVAEKEKLEKELIALTQAKNKLEKELKEVAVENQTLKQSINEKEDERDHLERLVVQLNEANQELVKQQQEERELLQAKVRLIEEQATAAHDITRQVGEEFSLDKELQLASQMSQASLDSSQRRSQYIEKPKKKDETPSTVISKSPSSQSVPGSERKRRDSEEGKDNTALERKPSTELSAKAQPANDNLAGILARSATQSSGLNSDKEGKSEPTTPHPRYNFANRPVSEYQLRTPVSETPGILNRSLDKKKKEASEPKSETPAPIPATEAPKTNPVVANPPFLTTSAEKKPSEGKIEIGAQPTPVSQVSTPAPIVLSKSTGAETTPAKEEKPVNAPPSLPDVPPPTIPEKFFSSNTSSRAITPSSSTDKVSEKLLPRSKVAASNRRKYATFKDLKDLKKTEGALESSTHSGTVSGVETPESGERTPKSISEEVSFPNEAASQERIHRLRALSSYNEFNVDEGEEPDEDKEAISRQSREWKEKLNGLRKKAEELRAKEQQLFGENEIGKNDKDWLLQELRKFRNSRAEENEFIKLVYELRERLVDAEIKNLARAMRTVTNFSELVEESNFLIDSVLKDMQKKVIDKKHENDNIKITSDLIIENCKLRKIANDYASAINQGTIDKLEKFSKYWPTQGSLQKNQKEAPKKNKIWSYFPLFDFFSGWATIDSDEEEELKDPNAN